MLINGRFLTRPATGVDRFAFELLRALRLWQPQHPARILVPADANPSLDGLPGWQLDRRGAGHGQRWEQLVLSGLAGDTPLVNLCNSAPLLRDRQMVVVHDAATFANPGNFSMAFRTWYRVMLAGVIRRSRVVASVSRFSASELTRYLGVRARGIEVIYESGEHILREPSDTSVLERLGLVGRRYVLALGNRSANKNFSAVLKAIELLEDPDLLLVAAGGGNPRVFAQAPQLGGSQLVSTGYVSDGQLRALYENAVCFAFPSYYEGFGIPPLEAMCCGCPVIVADRSALPEVCGDAAWYCDPDDPATLARQLRRLLDSAAARAELREAGLRRTEQFRWQQTAASFSQVMEANFR